MQTIVRLVSALSVLVAVLLMSPGVAPAAPATAAGAGVGKISGLVVNESWQKVAGANVILSDASGTVATTTSNSEGAFGFDDVPAGDYTVTGVKSNGGFGGSFITGSESVTVEPDETAKVTVVLDREFWT